MGIVADEAECWQVTQCVRPRVYPYAWAGVPYRNWYFMIPFRLSLDTRMQIQMYTEQALKRKKHT